MPTKIDMLKFADVLDKRSEYRLSDTITNIVIASSKKDKVDIGVEQSKALFAFMAWLTMRKEESGPFSAKHNASQAADLVAEFCKSQDWELSGESYDFDDFKPYPRDRKASRDEDDIMYCDRCGISEEEAEVSYEEFVDQDLCDVCLGEAERELGEHQSHQRWLKDQERERRQKYEDSNKPVDNSGFWNLGGLY